MNITQELTTEQIQTLKHWLFKENARIENEKQKLIDERREFENDKNEFSRQKEAHFNMHDIMKNQLVREKQIFDQKWKILERELKNLAFDKEQLKKSKAEVVMKNNYIGTEVFFIGVNNEKDLRKRFKDLSKIFHPDTGQGDQNIMSEIIAEYEKLKFDFRT